METNLQFVSFGVAIEPIYTNQNNVNPSVMAKMVVRDNYEFQIYRSTTQERHIFEICLVAII